ncbi:hypothetical protein GCK32_004036 [Trichostrongylus colubriformis]|uniref:Uncharacterized protein n=1 Tax=Trichostrongylus colubriformis TaxID=6319 RepID=A0AAN8FDK5_TRICO
MISLPGVVLLVRTLGKPVRLFHRNLIRIMQAPQCSRSLVRISTVRWCFGALVLIFGALVLSVVQFAQVVLTLVLYYDLVQVHVIAVTVSQISRIPAVLYETKIIGGLEDSINALVFVTVAIRFASLCSLMTMIPAMITERISASRFISDYEKMPRRWISALINSTAILLAASYYALSMLGKLRNVILLENSFIRRCLLSKILCKRNAIRFTSFAIFVWWLLSAIGDLRRILNACFLCYCPLRMDVERPPAVTKQSVHRIDDYFCQLKSAWAP